MATRNKSKVASYIYILFAVVFIGGHIVDIQPLLCNFLIALSGIFAMGYCLLKKGLGGVNSYLMLFGALFTILMLLSSLYNANADYLDTLWIWSYIGIAALVYECYISPKVFWGVAYSVILFILFFMFQGHAADELLKMGSENNISAYIIFFVLLGYLSEKKDNKAMRYIPAFLILAISLWTGSRSGVLSTVVLIGCIFLHTLLVVRKGKLGTLFKIGFLVFVGIWAVNHFFGDYMVSFFEKMDRYGNTSIRTEIWLEYMNGVFDNLGNFLFGVNMFDGKSPLLKYYDGNTHNSFLMLHEKFGIVGVLIGCIFMIKSILRAKSNKNIVLIIVALVASVRMFFDWIAFPGLYDVIFWIFALYAIDRRNVSSEFEAHNEEN